jgi:hypothetical protein
MGLRFWATAMVIGWLANPSPAQTSIAWKIKQGDAFYTETVHSTWQRSQTVSPATIETTTTTIDGYRVVTLDADKLILEKKTESRQCVNQYKQDGVEDAEKSRDLNEQSADINQKLIGAVVTLSLDPGMHRVSKAVGLDAHLASIADQLPGRKQSLAADYNDESVKDQIALLLTDFLPEGRVAPGAKWTHRSTMLLGQMGSFTADGTYTYRGKSTTRPQAEEIDVEWKLIYAIPTKPGAFEIKSGDLKESTARGNYLFDMASGKLLSHERELLIKGAMAVVIGGEEKTIPIEQKQTWKVRLLDKPPSK